MANVDFAQSKANRLMVLINETLSKKGNGIGCTVTKAIVTDTGFNFRLDRVPDKGAFEAAQAKVAWLFFDSYIVVVEEYTPQQQQVAMLVVPMTSLFGSPPVSLKEKGYLLVSFISLLYYSCALWSHLGMFV